MKIEPRLNNSEEVSSEASRGTRSGSVPESKIYIPNYQGVNQLLSEAGGDAVISFGDALAKQSMQTAQEYRAVDNKIEAANAMIDARANTERDAKAFLEANESGEGYMEFKTSKYIEYTQAAMQRASDPDVQQMIRIYSTHGLNDISNSAMKDEGDLRTGYQLSQVEDGKAAYLAALRGNPDLVESLSVEYDSLIQTMQKFSPKNYENYKRQSKQEFAMAYARGRIDRDPHQSLEMLKSGALANELQRQQVDSLISEAEREIAHREYKSDRFHRLEEKSHNQLSEETISQIKLNATVGGGNPFREAEEAYADGMLTKTQKNNLDMWLNHKMESQCKKLEISNTLDDCVANKLPAPLNICAAEKNDHFYAAIKAKSQRDGKPVSLVEAMQYAKDNSVVYNSNISGLKNGIVSTIRSSDDPVKIIDACLALNGNHRQLSIRGIDEECVNFAWLAYEEYFASGKGVSAIKKFRDEYFKPDKNAFEYNEKKWTETTKGKSMKDVLGSFFEDYGLGTQMGLFSNSVSQASRDCLEMDVYDRIKDLYLHTGSMTKAQSATAKYLNEKIKLHLGANNADPREYQ